LPDAQEAKERAHAILSRHDKEHHRIAQSLLERETLTAEDMRVLLAGRSLPPLLPPVPKKGKDGDHDKDKS
jgi:ATP-dependent Zn protease